MCKLRILRIIFIILSIIINTGVSGKDQESCQNGQSQYIDQQLKHRNDAKDKFFERLEKKFLHELYPFEISLVQYPSIPLKPAHTSSLGEDLYIATAILEVNTRRNSPLASCAQFHGAGTDTTMINTYVTGITFFEVLQRVVRGELFDKDPAFLCKRHGEQRNINDTDNVDAEDLICPVQNCDEPLHPIQRKKYPEWEPLNEKWTKRDNPDNSYSVTDAVNMLRENLIINHIKGTYLISVQYQSKKAIEAASIANMVAEVYIQFRIEKIMSEYSEALELSKSFVGTRE
jgi:hypothetical protein